MDELNKNTFYSILIPTYNRPYMLERALDSIIRQNFFDLEIIVIDDGSSIDYTDTIEKYKSIISMYHRNPSTLGVSFTRNVGLSLSSGEWIVFLDDDDEIADGYLSYLKTHIENKVKDPCFIWSSVKRYHYEQNGEVIGTSMLKYDSSHDGNTEIFKIAWAIGASYGLVINRNVLAKMGNFDTSYIVGEDTELIVRLMSNGVSPHPLSIIGMIKHEHLGERLSKTFNVYSSLNVYENICHKHLKFLEQHPALYKDIMGWCIKVHYRNLKYSEGDNVFNKLIAIKPLNYVSMKKAIECKLVKVACILHRLGLVSNSFPFVEEPVVKYF